MLTFAVLAAAIAVLAPGPAGASEVERLAGDHRIATAARLAERTHPDDADVVVLARADEHADALAAGPLAAARDAPLLLTTADGLHPRTAAQITRLEPRLVILAGGQSALPTELVDELHAAGAEMVGRAGGDTRFETAVAAAERVRGVHGDPATVYLADSGMGWPDALAASAAAGRRVR